jgi:hypothetical protein
MNDANTTGSPRKHALELLMIVANCLSVPLSAGDVAAADAEKEICVYLTEEVIPEAVRASTVASVERTLGLDAIQRTISSARIRGFVAGAAWALLMAWLVS